jgi:hypothetical protein
MTLLDANIDQMCDEARMDGDALRRRLQENKASETRSQLSVYEETCTALTFACCTHRRLEHHLTRMIDDAHVCLRAGGVLHIPHERLQLLRRMSDRVCDHPGDDGTNLIRIRIRTTARI